MQELKFSYGDVITIIALITSLGSVWRLNRDLAKPREETRAMVEEHHRILSLRKDEIRRVERKADIALRACLHLLNYIGGIEGEKEVTEALKDLQQELIEQEVHL